MSPLTIYTAGGLPKLPLGPQGPPGPEGAQGPAGQGLAPGGAVGDLLTKTGAGDHETGWVPRRRTWVVAGDNAGDGSNTSNTVFANAKSPVFTAPTSGWYAVIAGFNLMLDQNGATAVFALLVDGATVRLNQVTGNAGWFTPLQMARSLQLNAGQKVSIGYRPTVQGRTVTLVNSAQIFPMLSIEEVAQPS